LAELLKKLIYQFSSSRDLLECEQSYPGVPIDRPLLGFTIWIAGVVHEPGDVALLGGVDDPPENIR
jgi:hypothetical protein